MSVTVIILTKNEANNIEACIESARLLSDDIKVLDSGSTDRTIDVAAQCDVEVYTNPFSGFGDQRNWAIDNIPHRYEWAFHLDADERLTEPLCAEIRRVLDRKPSECGYFVANKTFFCGKWIKYSSGYPVFQLRLFHKERVRFRNEGHGQREVTSGSTGYLAEPYLHFAFSKGVEEWLHKHVDYALAEARAVSSKRISIASACLSVFVGAAVERRRALKMVASRIPARNSLLFWYYLLWKRGVLDGRAGIAYARLRLAYEAMFAAVVATQDATVS